MKTLSQYVVYTINQYMLAGYYKMDERYVQGFNPYFAEYYLANYDKYMKCEEVFLMYLYQNNHPMVQHFKKQRREEGTRLPFGSNVKDIKYIRKNKLNIWKWLHITSLLDNNHPWIVKKILQYITHKKNRESFIRELQLFLPLNSHKRIIKYCEKNINDIFDNCLSRKSETKNIVEQVIKLIKTKKTEDYSEISRLSKLYNHKLLKYNYSNIQCDYSKSNKYWLNLEKLIYKLI